jgi:hypothetical protein
MLPPTLVRVLMRTVVTLTVLTFGVSTARAVDDQYLASLVGKFPEEGVTAHSPGFFEVPSIRAAFVRAVPRSIRRAIE